MVHAACEDEALTRCNIFCWYGRFCEGQKDVQDDAVIGHPAESQTDGNIEKGWQLLLQNCYLSLHMIGDDLDISKDTVQKIVIENVKKRKVLKKRKVCSCLYYVH